MIKRIFKIIGAGRRHYTYGRDIAAWGLLAAFAVMDLRAGFAVSILAVAIYAIVKIRQNRNYSGTYDMADLFVTVTGGASVWIWVLLFKMLLS